jgi:hypothetical protein
MITESLATVEKVETVHVAGSRLQPVCRKLGIPFSEHFSHWEKNSNRHYPDRRVYDGVDVAPADAEKLNTYLADRAAKETAKAAKAKAAYDRQQAAEAKALVEVGKRPERVTHGVGTSTAPENKPYFDWWTAFHAATERYLALDPAAVAERELKAKRAAAAEKRVARELAKITAEVNHRWTLDAADVTAFAEHANEPGEGRVLRTKTACAETFETKVYMALVAWVRHNYTGYDDALAASKDSAYAGYLEAKENGDDWETKAQLLDDARAEHRQNHANLHKQFTDEAVAWLKAREVKTGVAA